MSYMYKNASVEAANRVNYYRGLIKSATAEWVAPLIGAGLGGGLGYLLAPEKYKLLGLLGGGVLGGVGGYGVGKAYNKYTNTLNENKRLIEDNNRLWSENSDYSYDNSLYERYIKDIATKLGIEPIEGRTPKDLASDISFKVSYPSSWDVTPLTEPDIKLITELFSEVHPETFKRINDLDWFAKRMPKDYQYIGIPPKK